MTNLECCTILQTKHDKHGVLCNTILQKQNMCCTILQTKHDKHGVLQLLYKQNMTNMECCTILQTKHDKHVVFALFYKQNMTNTGVLHYFTNKT